MTENQVPRIDSSLRRLLHERFDPQPWPCWSDHTFAVVVDGRILVTVAPSHVDGEHGFDVVDRVTGATLHDSAPYRYTTSVELIDHVEAHVKYWAALAEAGQIDRTVNIAKQAR